MLRTKKYIYFFALIIFLSSSFFAVRAYVSDEPVLSVRTQLNNFIRCYKKGNGGKKILLIGCVHGNEKAGIMLSYEVLNNILSKTSLKNTLICIPSANPDGNSLDKRTNSNNIDINRNFPSLNWVYLDSAKMDQKKKVLWGGIKPASEVETKFILKLDSIYKPDAFIILHQFMNCVQYDGNGFRLAAFISFRTKQKLLENIGYPIEGSIGNYFGVDRHREVVTIEIPENPSDTLKHNIINSLIEAVEKGY